MTRVSKMDKMQMIDVSLAQKWLLTYDEHCQQILNQAWVEIDTLQETIRQISMALDGDNPALDIRVVLAAHRKREPLRKRQGRGATEVAPPNGHISALAETECTK